MSIIPRGKLRLELILITTGTQVFTGNSIITKCFKTAINFATITSASNFDLIHFQSPSI